MASLGAQEDQVGRHGKAPQLEHLTECQMSQLRALKVWKVKEKETGRPV